MFIKYLIVFFVSMVPIVELRGAIPIAESMSLNIFAYYPIAIIGNMLPVPIIYLLKPIRTKKEAREKGKKGGEKLKATAGNSGIFWALLLFVGIPLPGTGAWTGTLAASLLDLDFKTSILAVSLGVILAGVIMSLGSKIVSIFGWPGVIAIITIILVAIILSIVLKKKRNK